MESENLQEEVDVLMGNRLLWVGVGLNKFPGHHWLPGAALHECPDCPPHEGARGNHVGRDKNKHRTLGSVLGVGRETRGAKTAVSVFITKLEDFG